MLGGGQAEAVPGGSWWHRAEIGAYGVERRCCWGEREFPKAVCPVPSYWSTTEFLLAAGKGASLGGPGGGYLCVYVSFLHPVAPFPFAAVPGRLAEQSSFLIPAESSRVLLGAGTGPTSAAELLGQAEEGWSLDRRFAF